MKSILFSLVLVLLQIGSSVLARSGSIVFQVGMEKAAAHTFQVRMECKGFSESSLDFKMLLQGNEKKYLRFSLGKKMERSFKMSPQLSQGKLQKAIYEGWVTGK